ncbi:hypothetical protein [Thorsellia anophelis]|uniref:Uncharacterized protein n=1 Tax=Thorsellia anophelis DSM 18579 TaxID=1123402 RepID=A0A1I0ALS6_9GAMM|nr:hypothetical protein [Thorsellia anophelis]SES95248.1 hypothetical protein SAMN02583745_00970 [Thorsellia anophelis DSM 18579]
MKLNSKKVFKTAAISVALSGLLASSIASAALTDAESTSTPTIKGYAPYLKSVGSRFVGKPVGYKGEVFIGDIIEVPTSAFNGVDSDYYTYRDGNATTKTGPADPVNLPEYLQSQDLDGDNETRNRQGQFLKQKVSVKWYIVEAKTDKKWADEIFETENPAGNFATDFNVADLGTAPYDSAVKSWDDVNAVALNDETYYVPMGDGSRKSLALRVPPEAANKRIGFIIVPESQTGDPFRGNPLKVPDLNFFWKQDPTTEPGDVCEVAPDQELADECDTNPGEPGGENPGEGGGFVKIRQYMINIRWSQDGTGVPKFDEAGRPIDPIVGTAEAPFPYTDEVYYPEISILTVQGDEKVPAPRSLPITAQDFRILTDVEKATIKWELTALDLDEDPNSAEFGQYVAGTEKTASLAWPLDKDKGRFIDLTCDAAVLADINSGIDMVTALGGIDAGTGKVNTQCNPYSDHAFRTQLNNPEAESFWDQVSTPFDVLELQEKSEQRMAIKVKFQYDNGSLDESNTQLTP